MTLSLVVSRVVQETERVRSFELRPADGAELPPFQAGAHLAVRLGNGLLRHYSLAGDPAERHRYRLGILQERDSRGGSDWIFRHWSVGERIEAELPANHFPLAGDGARHLLIAGGIGITPLLAMARTLARQGADYRLIYCTRSLQATPFRDELVGPDLAGRVQLLHDGGDPRRGLDPGSLLRRHQPGTHVYVCGPAGLIAAVRAAAAHWPRACVHFEYFATDSASRAAPAQADRAFAVRLASTGQVFEIPGDRSVLAVLAENGVAVPRLCEQGVCGSCLTGVLDGIPDHRDSVQTAAERARNDCMALCCSRALTPSLVLDL